ncbi:MAG: hypothetical protein HPY75_09505 [Actinobacteria bacterium]|nr:hypothetical protein [Actinomycetota bacterium]
MKRTMARLVLSAVCLLLLASFVQATAGCGGSKQEGGVHEPSEEEKAAQDAYEKGRARGREDGYEQGVKEGRQGEYDPEVPELTGADEDYLLGYAEGWSEGYEEGHAEGAKEAGARANELAEVEAAMIDFVKQNAAPGLEFKIENIVIRGDEAVGRAVCTNERLESPYVVMKKGASGWSPVDFGTGIEPPEWYPY